MLRQWVAVAAVLAASPAFAGETMSGEEARHFVSGKLFNYCSGRRAFRDDDELVRLLVCYGCR